MTIWSNLLALFALFAVLGGTGAAVFGDWSAIAALWALGFILKTAEAAIVRWQLALLKRM